jgi:hypothetical protein
LARAGRWFLESGIQELSGGVARYYRSEISRNKAVSTEITGYTASALAWLFTVTKDEAYLDRARVAARFLVDCAWNVRLQTFPFEYPSPSPECRHLAYFFDCGIIVRGLLAVWRQTGEERLLAVARAACVGMIADFRAQGDFHPILTLPGKAPLERTERWSRRPGCYQLKSALAWFDVAEVTGDAALREAWEELLAASLASHSTFLPVETDEVTRYGVMDRLHAYAYFLEALTAVLDRPECAAVYRTGLAAVERNLGEIAPYFVRSDVYAQLLRARIEGIAIAPLNAAAACAEARALMEFQVESDDPRIDGGFVFGRRDGVLSPHVNPVSTAFASQALEMWRAHQAGSNPQCRCLLI